MEKKIRKSWILTKLAKKLKFWAEYNLKYLIKRLEDDKEVA